MDKGQTKIVTIDELMQMRPPKPHIEIGFDKLKHLRGTWIELKEHIEGKLCPVCKMPVEQKFLEGVHWNLPNGSVCPHCGVASVKNRWLFSNYHGRYRYDPLLYYFDPRYKKQTDTQIIVKDSSFDDWNNYFIDPTNKDVYILITAVGESYQVWRDSPMGGNLGHHEWRVNKETIAIPMTMGMVGCNGKKLVNSIYSMK